MSDLTNLYRAHVEMTKEAILGPTVDALNLGIPSGVGYVMGRDEGRKMALSGDEMDDQSLLAALLMPGALGFRHGKTTAYKQLKQKIREESKK